MVRTGLAALALASSFAAAEPKEPPFDAAALVARNRYELAFDDRTLSGPGAAFLKTATADSQFVLFGEPHYQHEVPIFADALFRMLRSAHGFHHLAVEQDSLAMEDALKAGTRGDARKIGALAARYPNLFEFGSDQDLELLADVGRLESGADAICGLEQVTGPVRYFDELAPLAPNAAVKSDIAELRALALRLDPEPKYSVNFLASDTASPRLEHLRKSFGAATGSRADELLLALVKSAEIFGYYRRAEAGELVGLFNNTVREEWLKRQFVRCYRRAQAAEALPKVMFKFGDNHMYHGKNPTQAYPIGNFAHEFAIWNGMRAYGIAIVSLNKDAGYKDIPAWMRVVLPTDAPSAPTVIDLQGMRPSQRFLREKIEVADQWMLRDFINGFDAIVILPNDRSADMTLSGLKLLN
jgi:hypothetical protein